MSSKPKLFFGLNALILVCFLIQCEGTDVDDDNLRTLEEFPEWQAIEKIFCDILCGQSRFAFASILRMHCKRKCPNSPLANRPNVTTTTSAPSPTTATVTANPTVTMLPPIANTAASTPAAVTVPGPTAAPAAPTAPAATTG